MKQHPLISRFFLFFLFVCLAGVAQAASQADTPAEKIRIFFSGNVLAELGPCG